MTEKEMQTIIGKDRSLKQYIVIPNILMGNWYEADLILIRLSSKRLYEIEIKVDYQDFLQDFKKKHYHDHQDVSYFYYAFPEELYKNYHNSINKHVSLDTGIMTVGKRSITELTVIDGEEITRTKKVNTVRIVKQAKRKVLASPLSDTSLFNYMRLGCMKWCFRRL